MTNEKEAFFERLTLLGKGECAALRRAAGTMISDAKGDAIIAFYKCLPNTNVFVSEEKWFATACLYCLWDMEKNGDEPFEQIIADMVRKDKLSDSVKHRIQILLDTEWDADGYMLKKLFRLIKLVKQKDDGSNFPDYAKLLDDLNNWNEPKQRVQRKWAKTIFSKNEKGEE